MDRLVGHEAHRTFRDKGTGIDPAYNDLLRELERRAANRQARESRILSLVSPGIALVALGVTALKS